MSTHFAVLCSCTTLSQMSDNLIHLTTSYTCYVMVLLLLWVKRIAFSA